MTYLTNEWALLYNIMDTKPVPVSVDVTKHSEMSYDTTGEPSRAGGLEQIGLS